jgi:hypothetical protein
VDYPVSVTTVQYRDRFMVGIVTDPAGFPGDVNAFGDRLRGLLAGVDNEQAVRTA